MGKTRTLIGTIFMSYLLRGANCSRSFGKVSISEIVAGAVVLKTECFEYQWRLLIFHNFLIMTKPDTGGMTLFVVGACVNGTSETMDQQ